GLNKRCDIRFTAEFLNTQFGSGPALKAVMQRINDFDARSDDGDDSDNGGEISSSNSSTMATMMEENPRRPCAFIGAFRSAVSEVTSAVTGLENYVQVSGASTSTELDDTVQFPRFARTVPSDAGTVQAMLRYMTQVLKIEHLVILNDDDPFSNSYASNIRNYISRTPDMDLNITQVTTNKEGTDVKEALRAIKDSQFRYIFAIKVFASKLDELMEEAVRQGIAGNNRYVWFLSDGISASSIASKDLKRNSLLHRAYRGTGMILASGASPETNLYPDFVTQLQQLQSNTTQMALLKETLPRIRSGFVSGNNPHYTNVTAMLEDVTLLDPERIIESASFTYLVSEWTDVL
ncbi:MAG: hypothetical protein SGILL_005622, partial [Bacillariaceae sp.]